MIKYKKISKKKLRFLKKLYLKTKELQTHKDIPVSKNKTTLDMLIALFCHQVTKENPLTGKEFNLGGFLCYSRPGEDKYFVNLNLLAINQLAKDQGW